MLRFDEPQIRTESIEPVKREVAHRHKTLVKGDGVEPESIVALLTLVAKGDDGRTRVNSSTIDPGGERRRLPESPEVDDVMTQRQRYHPLETSSTS